MGFQLSIKPIEIGIGFPMTIGKREACTHRGGIQGGLAPPRVSYPREEADVEPVERGTSGNDELAKLRRAEHRRCNEISAPWF